MSQPFYSYIGGEGDDAPWVVAPWVTRAWVEDQRAILHAAPSKFRRVILNEAAGSDGDGLFSVQEIRDAIDPRLPREPAGPETGRQYRIGLDLGISNDWSALVLLHTDWKGAVVVDAIQSWVGTKDAPVNLMVVEAAVETWARRFRAPVIADRWNAALMASRLGSRRIDVQLVGVDQHRLDRIISVLKNAASKRLLRVSPAHTDLIEQMESVRTVEGRSARRDLLKFAPSGKGMDAGQHDDLIVACGIAAEAATGNGRHLGERTLPRHGCPHRSTSSLLMGGVNGLPLGGPVCEACPGWRVLREAWREAGPEAGDLRTFARQFTMPMAIERRFHQAMQLR